MLIPIYKNQIGDYTNSDSIPSSVMSYKSSIGDKVISTSTFNSIPPMRMRVNYQGRGFISGSGTGLVTIENVPASRELELRARDTRYLIETIYSNIDGTYRFDYLDENTEYDIIARDYNRVYSDVIIPAVVPWHDKFEVLNIPNSINDVDTYFTKKYKILGGKTPYSITSSNGQGVSLSIDSNNYLNVNIIYSDDPVQIDLADANGETFSTSLSVLKFKHYVTEQGISNLDYIGTFGDDNYITIPLNSNITFMGSIYNQIYVGSNSYITFDSGSGTYSGLTPSNPGKGIFINATDHGYGDLYFRNLGDRQVVRYSSTRIGNQSWEVTFFNDGFIVILPIQMAGVGTSYISNGTTSKTLTLEQNKAIYLVPEGNNYQISSQDASVSNIDRYSDNSGNVYVDDRLNTFGES